MRFVPAFLLALAAGCGGPQIPDMPPISVGPGGISLMTDAKTPAEAYDLAYSRLAGYHLKVRQNLFEHSVSTSSAADSLKQIIESVETMQELATEPWKSQLQPHIQWYREARDSVEGNRYGGSFPSDLDSHEREIRSKFSPGSVKLVDPPAAPPKEPDAAPPVGAGPAEPPKPAAGNVPQRTLFAAWKQSHADLVEAWGREEDCKKSYHGVMEALAAMKARLPEERRARLSLCEASYEQQNEETQGFSALPPGGKRDDVLRVLKLVGEMMDAEYNPDRK